MTHELSFELAGGPYAVTAARLALAETESRLEPSVAFDLRLLVSELVTNSVEHAGIGADDSIAMRVRVFGDGVRVEIGDGGDGFEPPRSAPDATADKGWGLYLVDQLASAWGVERGEQPYVWFELRRESSTRDDSDGEQHRSGVAA